MRVARTIDIDDLAVYKELKRRAVRDRRTLKGYVNLVLERHCGMALDGSGGGSDAPTPSAPRTVEELRDLGDAVKPSLNVKTGADLRREQQETRARLEHNRVHPEDVGQDLDF